MRQDVLVKLELLDQKHGMLRVDINMISLPFWVRNWIECSLFDSQVQDIVMQLHRFITAMSKYHTDCHESMKSITDIFPIEVDLPATMLNLRLNDSQGANEDVEKNLNTSQNSDETENEDEEDDEFGEFAGARQRHTAPNDSDDKLIELDDNDKKVNNNFINDLLH